MEDAGINYHFFPKPVQHIVSDRLDNPSKSSPKQQQCALDEQKIGLYRTHCSRRSEYFQFNISVLKSKKSNLFHERGLFQTFLIICKCMQNILRRSYLQKSFAKHGSIGFRNFALHYSVFNYFVCAKKLTVPRLLASREGCAKSE